MAADGAMANYMRSDAPRGKTSQVGQSRESFVIEVSREDEQDCHQTQDPRPTAEHAVAALRRSVFGASLSADIALPSVLKRPTPPQIFSELGPMDLVNLARTNKALRHVLMSRKSMCVWIVARRNAGVIRVPDPPEDMSDRFRISSRFCAHSIALRRTFTVSTSPSVVACAPPVGRESDELFSSTALDDSNHAIYRSLVFSTRFPSQCPDLKESVMSLLPYTKGAISFISQSSCRLLTRLRSRGMGPWPRRQ